MGQPNMSISKCVAAALVSLLLFAAPAAANDSPALEIIPPQPSRVNVDAWDIGTLQPTFQIQADFSKAEGAADVRCKLNDGPEGPCTARQDSCPVSACWIESLSFPADSENHGLTVTLVDSDGQNLGEEDIFFAVDATPPDTEFAPLPIVEPLPLDFPSPTRAEFGFDSVDTIDFPGRFECSLTDVTADAPGTWSPCKSERTLPDKLQPRGRYRFWVRSVDFLGRPDPTPSSYAFSPTPCTVRIVKRPASLHAMARKGLRLHLSCVQPTSWQLQLFLDPHLSVGFHIRDLLAHRSGRTTAPFVERDLTLHLHFIPRLPSGLLRVRHVRVGLYTQVMPGTAPRAMWFGMRGH
jgi:hypothetical protein